MTFRRARSEEQREVRRQAILETASSMLSDMPVSQISLNELSRRTGLAKSAMVRYFESREAVLLELLDASLRCWVTEIVAELSCDTRSGSAQERVDHLAALLSVLALSPWRIEVNVDVAARFIAECKTAVGMCIHRNGCALLDTDVVKGRTLTFQRQINLHRAPIMI